MDLAIKPFLDIHLLRVLKLKVTLTVSPSLALQNNKLDASKMAERMGWLTESSIIPKKDRNVINTEGLEESLDAIKSTIQQKRGEAIANTSNTTDPQGLAEG